MESFYGGRAGAAFVIVQRFDGINIPQPGDGSGVTSYTYTENEYAINSAGDFLLVTQAAGGNVAIDATNDVYLIERNSDNYKTYEWKRQENNGDRINSTSYQFPETLARGMVQCFAQGTKSASEVNYGEYVIIDTMLNMHCQNDPDNGKVFRRGMDVQAELAGAEYIGQIVGPQGDTTELDIIKYKDVIAQSPHREKTYTPADEDIVPGSYVLGGVRYYEDEVKYAYATIRDAHGSIEGCVLGFKTPTLIQDFEANSINPYTNRVAGTSGFDSKYTGLITEDPVQYQNDKWQHPFYQKWQINIPQGYHGINPEDIEVIHTYTMPPEYKGDSIRIYNTDLCDDTDYYKDITTPGEKYRIFGTEYEFIDSSKSSYPDYNKIYDRYYMEDGAEYDHDPSVVAVKIQINGGIKFVKKSDCYMDILRYHEKDFDDIESGVDRYFYIGDYNTVERVAIADDGTLTVFYSALPQPKELEEVLRWIDTKNSEGITIDDDGTVHVYYNTVHTPDPSDPYEKLDAQGRAHDHQDYANVLDWITEASLTDKGKFTILYNNNTATVGHDASGNPIKGNKYETTLQWINYVNFTSDGTVTFRWNTDNIHVDPANPDATPAYQFSNQIKYINNVEVENKVIDPADARKNGYEGTGDQKIHIKFNNDGGIDHAIGLPINYIIETCICTPTASHPNAPYSHLLVYYADPDLRLKLKDKWVTYPSTKIIDNYVITTTPTSNALEVVANGTASLTDKQIKETDAKALVPAAIVGDYLEPTYHVWKEWVDLGNTRGESGGIHIIKNVSSLNDLKDSKGKYIPPEKLTDANGIIINPDGAGWACSMNSPGSTTAKDILFYDYESKIWYSIGSIDSSSVDPSYIIIKSAPNSNQMPYSSDVSQLKANGFWFAAERCYYAF